MLNAAVGFCWELEDGIIKYFDERGEEEGADHQKNSKK